MSTSPKARNALLAGVIAAVLVAAVVGSVLLFSGDEESPEAQETAATAERESAAHETACEAWQAGYPAAELDEAMEQVRAGASTVGGMDGVEFYFDWVDVRATAALLRTAADVTTAAGATPDLDEATAAAATAHAEALTAYRAEARDPQDLKALAGELSETVSSTREALAEACADVTSD